VGGDRRPPDPAPAVEHRSDGGHDQQYGGQLEREEIGAEQDPGQGPDVPPLVHYGEVGKLAGRQAHAQPNGEEDLGDQTDPQGDGQPSLAPDRLPEADRLVHPQQHDHEQEQHHDGARVHDDLDDEQERRAQHEEHHRQREQVQDEP
jgi:hypothetical protein